MSYIIAASKKDEGMYSYNMISTCPTVHGECDSDEDGYFYYSEFNIEINFELCFRFLESLNDKNLKDEFIHHINYLNDFDKMITELRNHGDIDIYDPKSYNKFHNDVQEKLEKYLINISKKFNLYYYEAEWFWLDKDKEEGFEYREEDYKSFVFYNRDKYIDFWK